MIIENKVGYAYNDVTVVPAEISDISSRSECNPYMKDGKLPIFTSPMSTIVNEKNYSIWEDNNLNIMFPRNLKFDIRFKFMLEGKWVALSLNEFKSIFVNFEHDWYNKYKEGNTYYVCVDLANGHMQSLYDTINKAKKYARDNKYTLVVMTGNIANPETYKWICRNADVDYIRVSVGSGNNCITSTQISIHYPIVSLIDECYQYKSDCFYYDGTLYDKDNNELKSVPYIIADGGTRGYSDVIKAIALGADYVMIGSLFTAALESAGEMTIEPYNSHYNYTYKNGIINDGVDDIINVWYNFEDVDHPDDIEEKKPFFEMKKREFIREMKSITKESYGMSTKKAQKLINPNAKLKTSEGCTKYIPVKYTVNQWIENMVDYFKSTMSYTGKRTLKEFRGEVDLIINSNCAYMSVNK